MGRKRQQGVTLIEIVIVVIVVGVMAAVAAPSFRFMQSDQALRSNARGIADAFMIARAQAIRTGDNLIVVFQGATGAPAPGAIQSANIMDIIDDGVAAAADCSITAPGEVIWTFPPSNNGLSWGTTASLAGNSIAPGDPGFAPSNSNKGSTFTDATVSSATLDTSKFASWVVFQPDGIPRLMTPGNCANLGGVGQGGGGIYLTNGRRDYAIVLSALGTSRVHYWDGAAWIQ